MRSQLNILAAACVAFGALVPSAYGHQVSAALLRPSHLGDSSEVEAKPVGGPAVPQTATSIKVAADGPQDSRSRENGAPRSPDGAGPADPPLLTVQPASDVKAPKPGIDLSSGALVYRYPFTLPPGRNGFTPELSLSYSSQDRQDGSLVAYGWSLSVPYIVRENRHGVASMYDPQSESLLSSLHGRLARVAGAEFGAATDDGSFSKYTHVQAGLEDYWTTSSKDGTVYTFGKTFSAKVMPVGLPTLSYRWMLETIEDANGNKINFTYTKDQAQVYPSSITYASPDPSSGLSNDVFSVHFMWDTGRLDIHTSFAPGYAVITAKRLSQIEMKQQGVLVRRYSLGYGINATNYRSHLQSVQEVGFDESGALVTLPPAQFAYTPDNAVSFVSNSSGPFPPTDPAINALDFAEGVVVVDVNGDGYADVVQSYRLDAPVTEKKHVWINNGDGTFTESSSWQVPSVPSGGPLFLCKQQFVGAAYEAQGAVLLDVHGDARTDFVSSSFPSPLASHVFRNTGSAWAYDPPWQSQIPVLDPSNFLRPSLGDLNGDGLVDYFSISDTGGMANSVNTGSSMLTLLGGMGNAIPDQHGIRILDLNNDGLADIYRAYESAPSTFDVRVFLNQSDMSGGFVQANWGPLFPLSESVLEAWDSGSTLMFFADLTGDDLPDYVSNFGTLALHKWTHWSWTSVSLGQSGPAFPDVRGRQVGDVNGDGLLDVFYSVSNPPSTQIFYNTSTPPDLLTEVTLPAGGKISMDYQASSQYREGNGSLLNPDLPLSVRTVKRITETDPVIGASSATTYEYADGSYFYSTPFNRRFAGFGTVTTSRPDDSKEVSYFHQGNGVNSSAFEQHDEEALIGKPFRTDFVDANGNLMARTTRYWVPTPSPSSQNDRYFVHLERELAEDFDGNATHRDHGVLTLFDSATGDVLERTDFGEVTAASPPFWNVGPGPEDLTETNYTYATNASGMRLVATETHRDATGAVVGETRLFYDQLPFGQVAAGNVTREEHLVSPGIYAAITRTYIMAGLLFEESDALGHPPTTYGYDSFNLYPGTVTNALGHTTTYTYDYTIGKPIRSTDPNGDVRETVFDGLDRPIVELVPDPGSGVGTAHRLFYYAPDLSSTTTLEFLATGNPLESLSYFDSFGRTIQTRDRAEDQGGAPTYVVHDIVHDGMSRVAKLSLPYFSAGSALTPLTTDPNLLSILSYDAAGRVVGEATAVGTTITSYDQWGTSITDPGGHRKDLARDAYGRLILVREFADVGTFTTNYAYNSLGHLLQVTDALGNVRHFTYDSLGRRLSAEDLHAPTDTSFGVYSFEYDHAGNLKKRTTPNGDVASFVFDELNRLETEDFGGTPGTDATFTYDSCAGGIGRLCSALNESVTVLREYDHAGNVSKETKTIAGTSYETSFSHDLQGNETSITNPDGSEVLYTRNIAGLVESVSYRDAPAGPTEPIVTNIDYGPTGAATVEECANGTRTVSIFDSAELYRLRERRFELGASPIHTTTYVYDAVGNVLSITEVDGIGSTVKTYDYDALSRLTLANVVGSTSANTYVEDFTYNAVGNMTLGPAGPYLYGGDQGPSFANPHAATSIGGKEVTYDKSGNLLSDGNRLNLWNYRNELIRTEVH